LALWNLFHLALIAEQVCELLKGQFVLISQAILFKHFGYGQFGSLAEEVVHIVELISRDKAIFIEVFLVVDMSSITNALDSVLELRAEKK
jgi:hypothetical protein